MSFSKTLSLYSNTDISIWDKLEDFEDSYAYRRFLTDATQQKYMNSAQTAMTMVIALPKELPLSESRDLVEEFSLQRFVSRGLVVTYAIHTDEGNPHAHLQISRRSLNKEGEVSWIKDREICTKKALLETRKLWSELTNHYLEKNGLDERITHKSFVDLGLDLIPTKHEGWYARSLGESSRIVQENKEIINENKEHLLEKSEVILNEITHTKATFSQYDLLKAIQIRVGDDENQIRIIFEQALLKSLVVGEGLDGLARYTSTQYKEREERAISLTQKLSHIDQNLKKEDVVDILENSYAFLSEAQKEAVLSMTGTSQLSLLIGRAGAGKTTTLKAVAKAYLDSGSQVIGTSLSALASQNLGNEVGVEAATLHSYLYKWQKGIETLSSDHVILVDEAGMIGTRQWGDLLEFVYKSRCKIIAVGDNHQFKAIEAGDFFRELKESAKSSFYLEDIVRQKKDWMRDASKHFANLEVQEGLSLYEKQGCIHGSKDLSNEVAKMYCEKIFEGKEGLVLAFTNQQCQSINDTIRDFLKQEGKIDQEDLFTLNNRSFAKNDMIVFLENNKDNKLIKNGTRGRVMSCQEDVLHVCLKDETFVTFNLKDNLKIDHGYALTTHKSQGQTVDFTILAASRYLDAKGLYVAMTRHRGEAHLFYDESEFKGFKELSVRLSNFSHKDLVKDYTILPNHHREYERVQDYLLTTLDLVSVLKEKVIDWKVYRDLKNSQKYLGSEILNDFEKHELFIKQAGLTKENLEITIGVKQRFLSRAEEKARECVILYGQKSMEARSVLREGAKGSSFLQTLQNDRNKLAKVIYDSYPLHRTFVTNYSKRFGINEKTITSQALANHPKIEKPMKEVFDVRCVKEHLSLNIKDLAFELLGNPDHRDVRQWKYGKKGSVVIQVLGSKQGLYSNFETGDFGNVITLIQKAKGCTLQEAFEFGKRWLEGARVISLSLETKHSLKEIVWKPLHRVPDSFPSLYETPHLAALLKGRREVEHYAYKDENGHILGYVVRLEDQKGQKITPMLTYCENAKGEKVWRWKGLGDNRPLYGLELLNSDKPVLVVEGEKTANAAREIFPDFVVVTWSGGVASVNKTDWSPLKDKEIMIWPDNDLAGKKAAGKIQTMLKQAAVVEVPSHFPHKWDLDDPSPVSKKDLDFLLEEAKNKSLQKFEYSSIFATCDKHYVSYLLNEKEADILKIISKETYVTQDVSLERAHLTALYTLRAKTHLDLENASNLQKAWTVGMICAELKERGVHFNNDASLLWSAFQKYEKSFQDGSTYTKIQGDFEKSLMKISETIKNDKSLEKNLSVQKGRELER